MSMQSFTPAQWTDTNELVVLMMQAGEIIDGRFALVNCKLYEVISYKDCQGRNFDALFVWSAPDCCTPDQLGDEDEMRDLLEIMVWEDDVKAAHAKLVERMLEGLLPYE